jgi:hypothetical protein
MNNDAIKTGARYTSSRRDIVHGSLTFHVEVTGVHNGTVFATQYAVSYPNGSIRPSKPVRLEIGARTL